MDKRQKIESIIRDSIYKDSSRHLIANATDALLAEGVIFPDDFEFDIDELSLKFPKKNATSLYIPYTLTLTVTMPSKKRTYKFDSSFDREFFEKIGYEKKTYGHWIDTYLDHVKKCSACNRKVRGSFVKFDYTSCPYCRAIMKETHEEV